MTLHQQLHTIENFADLAKDQRFAMLVSVARQMRPRAKGIEAHNLIHEAGKLEGYLDAFDKINELLSAPAEPKDFTRPAPYTQLSHPENK